MVQVCIYVPDDLVGKLERAILNRRDLQKLMAEAGRTHWRRRMSAFCIPGPGGGESSTSLTFWPEMKYLDNSDHVVNFSVTVN